MTAKSLTHPFRSNKCYYSLACSIGSMGLACGSLTQIPQTTDRISLQRGLFLTSLGFIYFISLTDFCNKYLLETKHGQELRKKYRLMISDVLDITNKIVSAVQAFFSFLVGFIVCKSTCSKSFVYASHFLMEAYGWFGTAYFMYDIWSMYKVHTQKIADKLKLMSLSSNATTKLTQNANGNGNVGGLYDKHQAAGNNSKSNSNGGIGDGVATMNNGSILSGTKQHERQHESEITDYDGETIEVPKDGKYDFLKYVLSHPVMMIHHIFIGTFGLLVVTYIRGGGHCIYSYMYMMEFSTPFVSLRGILSTMGLKESRAYMINGLTMLGSFFVCRVFMWPYVMWRYSIAIDSTFWQAMTGLPRGCIISILILFLPQIYWFYLMIKGALKVFFPKSNAKKKSPAYTDAHAEHLISSKNNNITKDYLNKNAEDVLGATKLLQNQNLPVVDITEVVPASAALNGKN